MEVPLENLDGEIVISVATDFGMKKLELDTGASHSILNLSPEIMNNHQIIHSDHLVIGERDFGGTDFYVFEMPKHFKIDGILGRDFFANHAIYIDFKRNRALIR